MKYFLANYVIAHAGSRQDGYKLIKAEYLHQAEDIISNWLADNSLPKDFTSFVVEPALE